MDEEFERDAAEVFRMLDITHQNSISLNDALLGLRALEVTVDESGLAQFCQQNLASNTDSINEQAFILLACQCANETDSTLFIQKSFRILDGNEKGYITAEDVKLKIEELGLDISDEGISNMFKFADSQERGYITETDFARVISKSTTLNSLQEARY